MKINVLRSVAATLSMGFCTIASAQYGPAPQGPYQYGAPQSYSQPTQSHLGVPQTQAVQSYGSSAYQPPSYQSPSKWSNFGNNAGPALFQPAASGQASMMPPPEMVPTPTPTYGQPYTSAPVQNSAPQPSYSPQPNYSAPQAQFSTPAPQHAAPVSHGAPVHIGAPVDDSNCQSCNQTPTQSQFTEAASQPWEGVSYAAQSCGIPAAAPARAPLFPWFGSFDLLFFDIETNGKDRNLISLYDAADPTRPYLPSIGLGQLDPGSGLGYQVGFGRYLGCGQYGLGINYFSFNPDREVVDSGVYAPLNTAGGGSNFRASGMPHYNAATMDYLFDNGTQPGDSGDDYQLITGAGSPYTVYDIIDGRAGQAAADGGDLDADFDGTTSVATDSYAEAVRVRARRDVDIQGLEFNLFSFGLMGAQRASALNCGGGGCGTGLKSMLGLGGYGGVGGYGGNACQPCGDPCAQSCGPRFGFGGAAGPLVRPCNGKVQVITSHGIRWFQYNDSIDFAFDIDGRAGYTDNDLYDTTTTENNLIGYQFGSRLVYCLHNRVNLNVGGKFGIYGNEAEFRHRLGTRLDNAELAAMPGEEINYTTKDTVISTLGELDLGLGIRCTNAWTLRGGYRIMGVTGLASAANYARDYSSVASASTLHADTSLILHGAYIGADFNF